MKIAPNTEVAPGVKRWDIHKFSTYHNARKASFVGYTPKTVMLGNHDDPRPYWVVTFRHAIRLALAGYEFA